MGGNICYGRQNPLGTPPNWVLRTAIGPARCCARQLSPPVWRGSLALRSSRAQHPGAALGGFLIESGLQGMHSALKVSARAEVFDELRHSAHAGEGGDLQQARISETSDHAVVLIFVQQGFKHG